MLMISLSLKPDFALPIDQVPKWYGVSSNSAQRGLNELRERGVLTYREKRRDSWDGPDGYVLENRYTLTGPFELVIPVKADVIDLATRTTDKDAG
jgi:hypothetical protein